MELSDAPEKNPSDRGSIPGRSALTTTPTQAPSRQVVTQNSTYLTVLFVTMFLVKVNGILISNFRRVLNVVCFLLGNSLASEFYMPTFRNTLSVPFL